MRVVTDAFDATLQQASTKFARLWSITRADGMQINITDHDSNIMADGAVYLYAPGFTATEVLTSSLSVGSQNVELTVPLDGLGVTEADLRNRLYEDAKAVCKVVDWQHPENGTMILFTGRVGRVVLSDKKRATIEVDSDTDPNIYVADEIYCLSCRNDLGDANCKVDIFSLAANFAVTGLIDSMAFTVSTMNGQPDDYFALGQIKWLTGLNKGLISDVRTTALNLLSVGTFYPLPNPIQVGDTGQMLPGCDKVLSTCFLKFNNVLNFRGEPFAPAF